MPVKVDAVGRTYPPVTYAVGREKIREYARAVGETNPLHHDLDAARDSGHEDLPRAADVRGRLHVGGDRKGAVRPGARDRLLHLLHAGQEFAWGPLVVAGDEITTETEVKDVSERGGMAFYVFETRSTNQRGERVCTGTWTNAVRGA